MKWLKTLVILTVCVLLCGCSFNGEKKVESTDELVGVWVTYNEINDMILSENGFETEFSLAAEKCRELGVNTLFFHTVAFCDAVYPSRIYPFSNALKETKTDILKKAVEICHRNNIKIHAWINPFRVSTKTADLNQVIGDFEGYEITEVLNGNNVGFTENGIFLNPASVMARGKIIAAVREIIGGYDVDGVHFDDYFYPTTAAEFDKDLYSEYSKEIESPLTLEEWRRVNVNLLVIGVSAAARKGGVTFGISPAADLDYNYNTIFADVEGWIGGGYIDYIIPQLYFGFDYPTERFRFENLLTQWLDLAENKTKLMIGLAAYKSGTEQLPDNLEWQNDHTIIARQIELIRKNELNGFVFFSYSSLFSAKNAEQLKYIKEVL